MGVLKPRTTTVAIYQGDDLEHLAELYRAVERAEAAVKAAKGAPSREGDPVLTAQAERDAYDAAVDEAAERAVSVVLTTIGRRFRGLLAEHPARTTEVDGKVEAHEDDVTFGVNTETFPLALLSYNDDGKRTTTLDPAVSDAEVTAFLDDASDGDFERLWQTAYWLNRAPGSDPKDSKFSTASPRLDEN